MRADAQNYTSNYEKCKEFSSIMHMQWGLDKIEVQRKDLS